MLHLNGFDACEKIKSNPETYLIPVVLITALSDKQDRIKGIKAGADDFLTRPVERAELLGGAGSLLKLKHRTDELERAEAVVFFTLAPVSNPGTATPIEDVTGAEQLATSTSARQLVEVIGYPDGTSEPIICRNWTREPMPDQLEFDCGSYTDGTSGGPFLANVDPLTGQGTVIGVIGGYEQGGLTPQVSYSAMFEGNVAALYHTAITAG